MTSLQIALLIKPFAALAFFAAVVIPIELLLKRFWPEGRLKRILFDRTFERRRPLLFFAIWCGLMVLMIGCVYLAIYFTSGWGN